MTNVVYNHFKHVLGTQSVNLGAAGGGGAGTLPVALVTTNTTADTEADVATVSAFSTLDEYDGANYPSPRADLENPSYDKDAANNRSELTADPTEFLSLGPGTRQCQGAVVIYQVGASPNDANDIPAFWVDEGGFPFDGTGADVTVNWDTEGALQVGGAGNP